jgi:hypothetical protein
MWPQNMFPWFGCIYGKVLLPVLDDSPSFSLTKTWVSIPLRLTHRFAVTHYDYYVITEYYFDSFFLFDLFYKDVRHKTSNKLYNNC